jgi:hypothetical protein
VKYINAILMVVAAGVALAVAAVSDGQVSQVEGLNITAAVFGAIAVYLAPLTPDGQYVKWAIAGLTAGLAALVTVIGSGGVAAVTPAEWTQVAAVAVAAVIAAVRTVITTTPTAARAR